MLVSWIRPATLAVAIARATALFVLAAPATRAQAVAAGLDQGLFELRLNSGSAVTVTVLVNDAGSPLLPLEAVFTLTGYAPERSGDTLRAIPALGGTARVILDVPRRQIRRGADTIRLSESEVMVIAGEIFLEARRVGDLLQADAVVEWSLLQIVLRRTTPFPSDRLRSLESRRAGLRDRAISRPPPATSVPYHGRSGAGVLAWMVSDAIPDADQTLAGQATLGLAVAGGDLTLGGAFRTAENVSTGSEATASYRRAFPLQRIVRQIQLGDMVAGGAVLRAFRGATVSNAAVVRDYFFADVPVDPQVPSGWEYEIYQNGELLGFSDGTSSGAVSVPIRYGTTPLQVRLLSPSGDEIIREVLFQVPATQLPPGRFEYAAGGGACPTLSSCDNYAFAKADYGVRSWLTLGAGLESSGDTLDGRVRPTASASYAAMGGWQGQFQIARDLFARGSLGYYGDSPLGGVLAFGYNRPNVGQATFLETSDWRWNADQILVHRPRDPRRLVRATRLESRIEGEKNTAPDRKRLAVSADLPRGAAGVMYESDPSHTRGLYSLTALTILPSSLPGLLGNIAVNGAVGFAPGSGLEQADVSTSVRTGRRSSLSLALRWTERTRTAASLGFYSSLGFARATARANVAPRGASGGAIALNGITTFDPRFGVEGYDLGGTGLAGVGGTVFYDVDGDGKRGAADSVASNVAIVVGGQRERTDAQGEFRTWNVTPYEIVELSVDTLRGLPTNWIPLRPRNFLRATPHMYNRFDIPIVQTREMSARVVAGPGVWTAGGVTVRMRSVETGAVREAVTFSDGEMYVSRLRPGTYELTIAPASLQALGAIADPATVTFEVPVAADESLLELPPITLRKPAVAEEKVELAAPEPIVEAPAPIAPIRAVKVLRGVSFEVNRATLKPESFAALDSVADELLADTTARLEIAGHTDRTGTRAHNLRLSEARANTVRDYFIAQGVAPARLVARGYGPDQPVASNATPEGRARNRRTELRRLTP